MTETEGARLKRAREERGLTQVQVAEAARVDQTAVGKAERGKITLTDPTLGRIADALGVSSAWVRTGAGTGPAPREHSGEQRVGAPHKDFEEALDFAFDKARRHRLADVDAVRAAFEREPLPPTITIEELHRIAGKLLDAAAALRTEGRRVTLAEIVLKVAA